MAEPVLENEPEPEVAVVEVVPKWLNLGTKLEILSVDADGRTNVSTVDPGIKGWMAERLLTAPEI